MKVACSCQGTSLDDPVDPRFGRAKYLIIVDTDTMEFKVLHNEPNLNLPQGAGVQAARQVIDQEVKALITGNCGPKAFGTLHAAGIEVYTGASGTVREAVEKFKNGALTKADKANVVGHWV